MANTIINTIESAPVYRNPDGVPSGYTAESSEDTVVQPQVPAPTNPPAVVEEVAPVVEEPVKVNPFSIGFQGTAFSVDSAANPRTPILVLLNKSANQPIPSGV